MKKIEKIKGRTIQTPLGIGKEMTGVESKINEIIDFLNNSQQEERCEDCIRNNNYECSDWHKEEEKKEKCTECDGSGFLLDQEGDYNTLCEASNHKHKDQPSKPSIKDRIDDLEGVPYLTTKEKDQIISLITNEIIKKVNIQAKYAKRLGDIEYVKSLTIKEIKELINNIKK